jgi:hypothetical protein
MPPVEDRVVFDEAVTVAHDFQTEIASLDRRIIICQFDQ